MTKKKDQVIGDLSQEEQDALWENDPYSIKITPEVAAQRERNGFYLSWSRKELPEQVYSPGPERERYREFLKKNPFASADPKKAK